jgi:hypothetical protein
MSICNHLLHRHKTQSLNGSNSGSGSGSGSGPSSLRKCVFIWSAKDMATIQALGAENMLGTLAEATCVSGVGSNKAAAADSRYLSTADVNPEAGAEVGEGEVGSPIHRGREFNTGTFFTSNTSISTPTICCACTFTTLLLAPIPCP